MLAIGLPITYRLIDRDFFLSFITMEKPSEYILLAPTYEHYDHALDIAKIRNGLVTQALESGVDILIMMDTDQVYPGDTVTRILDGLKTADAVGGVVHRRYPPFNPLLMRGALHQYERIPIQECYGGDLIDVDATGCGCIGYRMSVFERIPSPWFELIAGPNGKSVGEDIRMCSKMKQRGMTIKVDTAIQIDHLTTFRVDRGTFELFERNEQWQRTRAAKTVQ
jgi:cellulose synthase/poly-beta-1,6-N-acetylglucosamine synthase-like glycosyltransferase